MRTDRHGTFTRETSAQMPPPLPALWLDTVARDLTSTSALLGPPARERSGEAPHTAVWPTNNILHVVGVLDAMPARIRGMALSRSARIIVCVASIFHASLATTLFIPDINSAWMPAPMPLVWYLVGCKRMLYKRRRCAGAILEVRSNPKPKRESCELNLPPHHPALNRTVEPG